MSDFAILDKIARLRGEYTGLLSILEVDAANGDPIAVKAWNETYKIATEALLFEDRSQAYDNLHRRKEVLDKYFRR